MERLGIFSRDERGCIYSRRMARDTHISDVRRAAAKSRHETEKRAANGKFCSDFAPAKPDFAPPKVPANGMQKPTVTATVPDSVSDSVSTTTTPPPLPLHTEWPLTRAELIRHDPASDAAFLMRLVHTCSQALISAGDMESFDDDDMATAIKESYQGYRGKQQHGNGLLLRRVPQIMLNWGKNDAKT
jgi:hypothetical protein